VVAGIMVNLVGEEGFSGQVVYENIENNRIDGVTLTFTEKKQDLSERWVMLLFE
jgi:5-(carboxyamino)imidazole ribonucleotide synthase